MQNLETKGFAVTEQLLSRSFRDEIIQTLFSQQTSENTNGYSLRNLLPQYPIINSLATQPNILNLIQSVLGNEARPVKATWFDKTPAANWKVPAHQDVTIVVQKKIETPGFSNWSVKDGMVNVQPPPEILEQILALRIHLDECPIENGALKVWPGSHRYGRLRDAGVGHCLESIQPEFCPVPELAGMLMRPLLVHASSASTKPVHRRVIHIEYTACILPNCIKFLTDT